ncbi:unnamed protein product, partial [Mesorhabditis belari]|uniref:Methylglutaconyl-CoA hydratase, mitochondrial n=1 Tax=Mesorhabditis belari TaxID=2138241 RepID=A0AAF3F5A1_9BILA
MRQIAKLFVSPLLRASFIRSLSSTTQGPLWIDRLEAENKGIVVLRMKKPETKNAISKLMLSQLRDALAELKFDRSARVVILKSDVPGAFCAGADLKERKSMAPDEVPIFVNSIRAATTELSTLPQPTIAAIDGVALGGGLELALSCDLLVASDAAKMGLTETRLAIIPGAGGTQRLTRLVGVAKAKELIFTARILDSKEALSIGLVNAAVEKGPTDDGAYNRAIELAKEMLQRGPVALRVAKIAIDTGSQLDLQSGLMLEQQCYAQVIPTRDRIEGLAAFAEKRKPNYKGE